MPKDFLTHLSDGNNPPTYSFFNGEQWVTSISGKTIDVISPIDNSVLGKIQSVTGPEADQAIIRAQKAQKEWQEMPRTKRGRILHLAADWIRHHESMMTQLLVLEIGKSIAEAKDEILRSADMIDYFANEGLHLTGEELSGDAFPGYDQTKMAIVERVPLGLVLAIPPFNYPLNLAVSKLAPALMTGNAVVYKPPTQGSVSSLLLTEIFYKAGLPKGIIVTLTGSGSDIGNYLVTHKAINMITFTGSSHVGKNIAAKAGMIPLLFECGGNNPALVLDDTDVIATAGEIVKGAFSYAGQRCTAIKYVVGRAHVIHKLLPKVIELTEKTIKIGDPRVPENNMGPLISDAAATEVFRRITQAKTMGARIEWGGEQKDRYIEPTILTNVRSSMEIVQNETFGPVVSFLEVKSIDDGINLINESKYGLQASIFTKDEGTGIAIGNRLDVGTVQINSKPQRGPDHFPFMGVKGSGVGVQGIKYSLEAMTRLKSVVLNTPH